MSNFLFARLILKNLSNKFFRAPLETSAKDDRGATVLSQMERFPDQHGRLLQTSQGWEELLRRDHRHRGEIVDSLDWIRNHLDFEGCFLWHEFHEILQGQHTKAHKMILCACSPYFKNLLDQNPAKHPIIILKVYRGLFYKALTPPCQDVPFAHLNAILEFMYAGEVRFLVAWRNFLLYSCLELLHYYDLV